MLTPIEQVRLNVQDNEVGFYILSDEDIEYLIESSGNVNAASVRAAQTILFKLAQRGDETVDLFSIKGSKAASEYRLALQMYIKNPSLNPMMQNMTMYVGGISKSDIEKNKLNPDNKLIIPPDCDRPPYHRFPFGWTVS